MKTGRENFSDNGLFLMSPIDPEELTHEAIEAYLAKGRRLHAAYVCDFFLRLRRLLQAVFIQTAKWIRSGTNAPRAEMEKR